MKNEDWTMVKVVRVDQCTPEGKFEFTLYDEHPRNLSLDPDLRANSFQLIGKDAKIARTAVGTERLFNLFLGLDKNGFLSFKAVGLREIRLP